MVFRSFRISHIVHTIIHRYSLWVVSQSLDDNSQTIDIRSHNVLGTSILRHAKSTCAAFVIRSVQ